MVQKFTLWFHGKFLIGCLNRFDEDCAENNPEAALDKSKPWSRSIEDLHGGGSLPSSIAGNSLTRAGRHSTIRYNTHTHTRWWIRKFPMCVTVICNFATQGSFLPPSYGAMWLYCDYFEKSHFSNEAPFFQSWGLYDFKWLKMHFCSLRPKPFPFVDWSLILHIMILTHDWQQLAEA